ERVEGMSLDALLAGVGRDWPFESFAEFLDAIEARGTAINVGALVGHTPVRLHVLGDEASEREATAEEVATMRTLVRDALHAGALGFATSKSPTHVGDAGRPVPSRAAALGEIETLAGTLGEAGHGVMQATIGPGFFLGARAGAAGDVDRAARRHARARRAPLRARAIRRAAGRRGRGHSAGVVPAPHRRVPAEGALPAREHVGVPPGVAGRR